MTYLDLNFRLPELLLMRIDKMTMAVGLEGRVPFLDHKFVELAMSIPGRQKAPGGNLKHLLKRAVTGLIPAEIINRKKQGFGVPVYEWFFQRLGEKIKTELDAFCRATNFLDRTEIAHLFRRRRGPQLWYLLNLAMWWKTYINR
jgi:asparagine synthase (glutamine-hydrolysing)